MQISVVFRDNTLVSTRWKKSYFINYKWQTLSLKSGKTAEKVHSELLFAEFSFPEDEVLDRCDEIIGNNAWTHHHCQCCHNMTREPLIHLGPNDEYESGNMNICKPCLAAANKISFEG